MNSEDLVTVCTVQSPTEAEIIRNALQSVGIRCEIGGESQAGLAGVLEIDVLTHASDLDEARKYLKQLQDEKLERKKKRAEAKHGTTETPDVSEAIQEGPPPKHAFEE